MPQMSPLSWSIFPMVMLIVMVFLASNLFDVLINKESEESVKSKDEEMMWW